MMHTLSVRTGSRVEMVDITSKIQDLVRTGEVEEGVCHLLGYNTIL